MKAYILPHDADNSIPRVLTESSRYGVKNHADDQTRVRKVDGKSDVPTTTTTYHLFAEYVKIRL